jgi:hypothetical protein
MALNCHGCLCPSHNEYQPGSWVILEVPSKRADAKPHPVRAQVRFIRPSQNPSAPYYVGVELETPANVWGIELPPEDWLRFPGGEHVSSGPSEIIPRSLSSPTSRTIQQLSDASPGWDMPMRVAPDEVKRAFDTKLLQAAERAVALAVTSHVDAAVTHAVKSIEAFSQAAAQDAEQRFSIYREKLLASAREQLEGSLAEAQETAQRLERRSSDVHIILAEALDFLQETAREMGKQFSTSLQETAGRAAADFGDKTARFSDRHLAGVSEQVQVTTGEAMTRLEGRAAEASAQLDRLTLLAADARTEWEGRRQASRDELARESEQAVHQFRERMEAIWNSSMVAAMSAVNEHSRSVLDSLSKEPAQQLREASPSSR